MKIFSKNPNNISYADKTHSPAFKGGINKVTDSVTGVVAVARRASCPHSNFSNTYNNLLSATQKKAPELVESIDGVYIAKEETLFKRLIEAGRDFFELPLDLFDDIVSHFPNSKLNNLGILQKHREHILEENKVKAFQGLFEYGSKYLKDEKVNKNGIAPSIADKCSEECKNVCNSLTNKFNEQMNKAAELNKAIYDTKKERFDTRMISGLTGALFLGNDFYNSAILKGKNEEEAKKAQRKKQGQEIKENIIEGFAQYGTMACFAKLSQSNIWFSVASGVGVSTLARILSRKMSGMRITRMKAPENSMAEFVKAAKNSAEYKTQSERDKEAKKPILSLKNILLASAGIIAAGFAFKKLGAITGIGDKIKLHKDNAFNNSIEEIIAKPDELKNMASIFEKSGEIELGKEINEIANLKCINEEISIGQRYKTKKLPGGLTVTQRALKKALMTPITFVKEFVTYPYKLASNFVEAFKKSKMNKEIESTSNTLIELESKIKSLTPLSEDVGLLETYGRTENRPNKLKNQAKKMAEERKSGSEKLKDTYNIKNLYIKYKKFEEKFGKDPQRLEEEFGKYIEKLRVASLNNKTSSKIKNSQIGVLAQITGTLTGMWFNMNDEYNAAIKNGDNKQDAQKAARKRGLNKFARMASQVAIFGALSKLFRAQYEGSLFGAGVIVAVSTVITDMVSRVLTAMPTKKMNKEQLEQYQEQHKTGKMAWYYNLIDKLAS